MAKWQQVLYILKALKEESSSDPLHVFLFFFLLGNKFFQEKVRPVWQKIILIWSLLGVMKGTHPGMLDLAACVQKPTLKNKHEEKKQKMKAKPLHINHIHNITKESELTLTTPTSSPDWNCYLFVGHGHDLPKPHFWMSINIHPKYQGSSPLHVLCTVYLHCWTVCWRLNTTAVALLSLPPSQGGSGKSPITLDMPANLPELLKKNVSSARFKASTGFLL